MAEPKENVLMEKIVSLCKRRGFIFQSSEIYGGINGFWDYGPLGAELKRNVKELWWNTMTRLREDVVGLEATIIMHPQIWKASGHVDTFADMMRECPVTKKRVRADQVEPQTGTVYRFFGAYEVASGEELRAEFGEADLEAAVAALYREAGFSATGQLAQETALTTRQETLLTRLRQSFRFERVALLITKMQGGRVAQALAAKNACAYYRLQGMKNPCAVRADTDSGQMVEGTTDFHSESGFELGPSRPFNLMFKTYVGPVADEENVAYLRPETAQAIFAQFKNVLDSSRQKAPFGIAQIGKAFRNEVTPRNFTFRSREFEQMELEFFIKPDEAVEAIAGGVASVADAFGVPPSGGTPAKAGTPNEPQPNWGWEAWHKYWVEERIKFYEGIGLPRTTLEEYWQRPEELAHYARATVDILFKFPFGTQELEGIAARSDFDLSQHERFSGKPMGVFDEELRAAWGKLDKTKQEELWRRYFENRKKYLVKSGVEAEQASKEAREDADALAKGHYIPHVIEPSAGVDRLILALICNAYSEDQMPDEKGKPESRVVLKLHPRVAPIKVAVLPLLKNKPNLVSKAQEVRDLLRKHMNVFYDDTGAIGRRYRRQDEAGTPFCVTVDFETFEGMKEGPLAGQIDTVTVRHRDDGAQERLHISGLLAWLVERVR